MPIKNCPMGNEWREWGLTTYWRVSKADEGVTQKADNAKFGKKLKQIEVTWETAPDDAQFQPVQDLHFIRGFPSHLHAEFEIDDDLIHVDRLYAQKNAPGSYYEDAGGSVLLFRCEAVQRVL